MKTPITYSLSDLPFDEISSGFESSVKTKKIKLPIYPEEEGFESTEKENVAELYVEGHVELAGSITIEHRHVDWEQDEGNTLFPNSIESIQLCFDEEAVESLSRQKEVPLYVSPPKKFSPEVQKNLDAKGVSVLPEETEILLSEIFVIQDEDEEEEFEYMFMPDIPLEDSEDDGFESGMSHLQGKLFSNILEVAEKQEEGFESSKKKPKLYRISLIPSERNKAIRKARKFAKRKRREENLDEEAYVRVFLDHLTSSEPVQKHFSSSYQITVYDPDPSRKNPFRPIEAKQIDYNKKTLILVPGNFVRTLKKRNKPKRKGKRGEKKLVEWDGSFKYFMMQIQGLPNWFDLAMMKGEKFEQIIALEHDSIFHSAEENIVYLHKALGLGSHAFTHPTSVIACSRGGMLAKFMALVGSGKYTIASEKTGGAPIGKDEFNLNIEKIVTVASGHCGYVDPIHGKKLKKGIEFLLSLLNLFSPGFKASYGWITSLPVAVVHRLPSLKMQVRGSVENELIKSHTIQGLYSFPFANNYSASEDHTLNLKKGAWKIIEKTLVDKFLGDENDFVIMYDSQRHCAPGNLMEGFEPSEGFFRHGDGMLDEKLRTQVFDFLMAKVVEPLA
ncbi:MAG: hypothetical protein AAGA10_21270 [Bacteroidota bacterium]